MPEVEKLCNLQIKYLEEAKHSPVEGRYVSEAAKLLPWEELGQIAGMGPDHPILTNLRRSLDNGSMSAQEGQKAVRELRDVLVKESGGKKPAGRESADLGRLVDSVIRIGLLTGIGGALGPLVGVALVSESISAEVTKGVVVGLAGGVAEEAIYPLV
jgi:hypothetical protein